MSDDLVSPVGTIEDCAACVRRELGPPPPAPRAAKPKKPRKPRSKGKGDHCVVSHKGNVVFCYKSKDTAERVAESFTKRGRAGTRFTVQDRKKTRG